MGSFSSASSSAQCNFHSQSQHGLSLEFVAATVGSDCNIQDAMGGGLCIILHAIP